MKAQWSIPIFISERSGVSEANGGTNAFVDPCERGFNFYKFLILCEQIDGNVEAVFNRRGNGRNIRGGLFLDLAT